jgi:hypothetical protein
VIVFATWLFLSTRKTRLRNVLKDKFYTLSRHNDLYLNKSQTLNGNMIGIDRRKLKILFLNRNDGAEVVNVLDLRNVVECSVQNEINPTNGFIKNINLRCTMRKPGEIELLNFYKENLDPLDKKMRLSKKASYWEKTINLYKNQK